MDELLIEELAPDELAESPPLTEADYDVLVEAALASAQVTQNPTAALRLAPLLEAASPRIIVPKKGPIISEDNSAGIAIMRPCISRGRRLKGLPPMYEQAMLARNAAVFANWPMFVDHVPPELAEKMAQRGRSVRDLGGRIVESHWDPDFVAEYDEQFGYWKGAIVGRAIPQQPIAGMISTDPDVLHCSINAWPTSAKPKRANGTKVMAIEGIRSSPQGSVDWVVRGGAGGRVLTESEVNEIWSRVVRVLEGTYTPAQPMTEDATPDFSKMSLQEMQAWMQANAPHLAGSLREEGTPAPKPTTFTTQLTDSGLSEARVTEIVTAAVTAAAADSDTRISQLGEAVEERAREIVAEREHLRSLAEHARTIITNTPGLGKTARADLLTRYALMPSGPTAALALCESQATDETTPLQVLETSVEADIKHAMAIIAEAQGRPSVRGQGGGDGTGTGNGNGSASTEVPYWRQVLVEQGVVEKPEDALNVIRMAD